MCESTSKTTNGFAKQHHANGKSIGNGHAKHLRAQPTEERPEKLEHASADQWFFGSTCYFMLFCYIQLSMVLFKGKKVVEDMRDGYADLFTKFEVFYIQNCFKRSLPIFFRAIGSVPGATVKLIDRQLDDSNQGKLNYKKMHECINLGSYNYLGFAENKGPVTDSTVDTTHVNGLAYCSSRQELGYHAVQKELEQTTAEFLGTEDAITLGMGFATNVLNLPMLVTKGTLVISDEKNHASLVLGVRLSGASVKVFKHNDVQHLERLLRHAVIHGQPRTKRPWKKILIMVEGVYSMEGTIVKLPQIIALKKKYKAYLYLDEAHSVGAMGPRGRGVVDYYGLDVRDVDIMMGTYTKSFGSAGGYIAGSKALVNHLRVYSQASVYPVTVSPPVARQIISSMREIMDGPGMARIRQLGRNSKYFRQRLKQLGAITYGHDDSPVVPLMTFHPTKMFALTVNLEKRGIATVGVGFPATGLVDARIRFCVSASHTKAMLDKTIDALKIEMEEVNVPLSTRAVPPAEITY